MQTRSGLTRTGNRSPLASQPLSLAASSVSTPPSSTRRRSSRFREWLRRCVGAVAVLERGEGRRMRVARLLPGGDEPVDVAHQVAERVGPGFLVAAGQVRVAARPRRRSATGSFCRISFGPSRWPNQSSFWCSCRHFTDAFDPHTSSTRSFLWPAQTWPTENAPLAPLSNRTSTDARSSTLMSTRSYCLLAAAAAKRLARSRRLLALRDHRRDVAEHLGDPAAR